VRAFEEAGELLLKDVEHELGWMYETLHTDGKTKGHINFTVWSENFSCPECGKEFVFHHEALDQKSNKIRDVVSCPNCGVDLTKDNVKRERESVVDPATGNPWRRVKFTPVVVNYSVGGKKYEKSPDKHDQDVLARIAR